MRRLALIVILASAFAASLGTSPAMAGTTGCGVFEINGVFDGHWRCGAADKVRLTSCFQNKRGDGAWSADINCTSSSRTSSHVAHWPAFAAGGCGPNFRWRIHWKGTSWELRNSGYRQIGSGSWLGPALANPCS